MPNSDKGNLTRREREREQHKQEILDAAEEVFAQSGITGATIEDVAKKADFAVGSIYNFFSGKEDLSQQVFLRVLEGRLNEVVECVNKPGESYEEKLLAMARVWISHHSKHGAFLRMMFAAMMAKGPKKPPEKGEPGYDQFMKFEQTMEAFFAGGVKAGVFKDLPPAHLALVFDGICRSFVMFWERTRDKQSQEKRLEELFRVVNVMLMK